ncbi:sigma factor [Paenibacillus sp. FSL W8-0919]|uniref:sigma factor n=1 Tax=Paenibacillus sp. FSL W8-0919 TaxID=2954707 RepID=UPI0030FB2B47
MNEMDIKPWLIRMSQGDEEAFRAVYDLTRDQAYGLIYYLAPNKQEVPDIMSEVYIELIKSLDNYEQGQKFSSWFNGLIIRQVRNWKRKSWLAKESYAGKGEGSIFRTASFGVGRSSIPPE